MLRVYYQSSSFLCIYIIKSVEIKKKKTTIFSVNYIKQWIKLIPYIWIYIFNPWAYLILQVDICRECSQKLWPFIVIESEGIKIMNISKWVNITP